MASKTRIALSALMSASLLLACTLGTALTSPPTATASPPASSTPPALTSTPVVNLTPDTPVPSATIDPNSPEYWACRMRSQVPRDGARYESKERFDVAWQVENFGYGRWEPDTIRVTYFSGTRMQVNDSVKLKEPVDSDRWTQFVVPMVAPRAAGKYTTVWALWYGDNDFCHMTLSIVVK